MTIAYSNPSAAICGSKVRRPAKQERKKERGSKVVGKALNINRFLTDEIFKKDFFVRRGRFQMSQTLFEKFLDNLFSSDIWSCTGQEDDPCTFM